MSISSCEWKLCKLKKASYVKPFSPKSDQKQYWTIKIQPIDANTYTIQGKQGFVMENLQVGDFFMSFQCHSH